MAAGAKNAQLSYTEMFTADELIVEFDGVTYLLANEGDGKYGSGSLPNSISPIGIRYINGVNRMYIDNSLNAGDHHVVIKSKSSSIETTECFKKAVKSVSGGVMMLKYDGTNIEGATWQEAYDALQNGTMVYLDNDGIFPCTYYNDERIVFTFTCVDEIVRTTAYIWQPDGSVVYDSATYPPQPDN